MSAQQPSSVAPVAPVVGFDLDLTLVDSTDRIATCLVAALAAAGASASREAVWRTIGIPIEMAVEQLAPQLDAEGVARVSADYRRRRDEPDAPPVHALRGAAAALAAVREAGGRTLVVSAKPTAACRDVLAETGLADVVDELAGGLFAADKATALVRWGATAYVGDHPGDIAAARAAGVEGVSVATGPHDADELRAAGATTVLADLLGFPAWLDGHRRRLRRPPPS